MRNNVALALLTALVAVLPARADLITAGLVLRLEADAGVVLDGNQI